MEERRKLAQIMIDQIHKLVEALEESEANTQEQSKTRTGQRTQHLTDLQMKLKAVETLLEGANKAMEMKRVKTKGDRQPNTIPLDDNDDHTVAQLLDNIEHDIETAKTQLASTQGRITRLQEAADIIQQEVDYAIATNPLQQAVDRVWERIEFLQAIGKPEWAAAATSLMEELRRRSRPSLLLSQSRERKQVTVPATDYKPAEERRTRRDPTHSPRSEEPGNHTSKGRRPDQRTQTPTCWFAAEDPPRAAMSDWVPERPTSSDIDNFNNFIKQLPTTSLNSPAQPIPQGIVPMCSGALPAKPKETPQELPEDHADF